MAINNKYKLQKCWIWPKAIYDFVKDRIHGRVLNVCCGMNDIGDVRVDLDPKDKSIIKADMKALPFEDDSFDTVIQDPPWKIDLYNRFKPFYECVRVCKPGGIIIYNSYWLPQSNQATLEEVYIRQDNYFTNVSVIALFRKNKKTEKVSK